jgi:hypothetical protein
MNATLLEAQLHATNVKHLASLGQIVWTEFPCPKPDAMRSFSGVSPGYQMVVIEANTKEFGVVHEVVITTDSGLLIHLDKNDPSKTAQHLYRNATTQRN